MPSGQLFFLFFLFLAVQLDAFNSPIVADTEPRQADRPSFFAQDGNRDDEHKNVAFQVASLPARDQKATSSLKHRGRPENLIKSVGRMSTPIAREPVQNYLTPAAWQRLSAGLLLLAH